MTLQSIAVVIKAGKVTRSRTVIYRSIDGSIRNEILVVRHKAPKKEDEHSITEVGVMIAPEFKILFTQCKEARALTERFDVDLANPKDQKWNRASMQSETCDDTNKNPPGPACRKSWPLRNEYYFMPL